MCKEISSELIEKVKSWLSSDGIEFFKGVKEEYGNIATACWMVNSIPHPIHFREGMEVRNFLRSTGLCDDWTDHDFDNQWANVVVKAIEGT